MDNVNILAVIPARGGSKGVPRKNIRLLNGKPLLVYAIEEAKKCQYINRIVVSSDDYEILKIAEKAGAEPILRPEQIATDTASTEDVLIHAVNYLKKKYNYQTDIVVTLPPTSPLRTAATINKCIKFLLETGADSVLTVNKDLSCFGTMGENGVFKHLWQYPRRRQDRKPIFKENSAVYVTKKETLFKKKCVLGDDLRGVIIEDVEAIDINTEFDFYLAEYLIKWGDMSHGKNKNSK
jgi:CMP-N-acetylneuraminic acid synthetase